MLSHPSAQPGVSRLAVLCIKQVDPSLCAWYTVRPNNQTLVFGAERSLPQDQERGMSSLCSKDPNSLVTLRQGFLKPILWVRVIGCLISSRTFFWLVGGKVTGWCFGNLSHQSSSSNQSEVYVLLWSACTQHHQLSFCRTAQRYGSDCYLYPSGGTRSPVTIV